VPQLPAAIFSSIFGYPRCRTTAGKGVDIVIESIGGIVTSGALRSLGLAAGCLLSCGVCVPATAAHGAKGSWSHMALL